MAADQGASEKTLEEVAKQLENVNSQAKEQISLSEQAGFHQRKAMAIAADSATELAQPVATLVRQGEAQIEAAQDAARSAAEAAREAARAGDVRNLEGSAKDASILLSLLWNFDPIPDSEAILNLGWKDSARVAIDGWVGVSGRLISACMQTDATFHTDGPVTGFRRRDNGEIDGIKRKGRVLPVDAVIQASSRSDSVLYGRYLGLSGDFLRPHVVLWDADREVLLVDLASVTPERVPEEYRGRATLLHCLAFGDSESAADRIESLLDAQCSGWLN